MPNRIPLDPELPKTFDATPNDTRCKQQLDAWWDRPYGITFPTAEAANDYLCANFPET
jgi:hypothetical protein